MPPSPILYGFIALITGTYKFLAYGEFSNQAHHLWLASCTKVNCMRTLTKKFFANERGQVATEYAAVLIIMAFVGSLVWIFYQGLTESTFYGLWDLKKVPSWGLERTISFPYP